MNRRAIAVFQFIIVVTLLLGVAQPGHPQAESPPPGYLQAGHTWADDGQTHQPRTADAQDRHPQVYWEAVAKIREEGFQRSEIAETLSYMTDVLGARLTLSEGMTRAQ